VTPNSYGPALSSIIVKFFPLPAPAVKGSASGLTILELPVNATALVASDRGEELPQSAVLSADSLQSRYV
jgi:hypothetical protein